MRRTPSRQHQRPGEPATCWWSTTTTASATLIKEYLARAGFRVSAAADAAAARGCSAARLRPAGLDVMMPGEDGFSLRPSGCASRPGEIGATPVLILTARGLPDDRIEGLSAGRRRLPGQAVRAARSWCCASRPSCAAPALRPPPAGRLQLGRCSFDPARGELLARRRAGAADRGRGPAAAPSSPAPPRAGRPLRAGPRDAPSRRPRGRHPGHPPAPQDRGRPEATRATCRPSAAWATCWRRTDAACPAPGAPSLLALLKRRAPTSLFGRSLLIIVLPIAVMQIAVTWVFFDAHWQTVNGQPDRGPGRRRRLAGAEPTRPIRRPAGLQRLPDRAEQALDLSIIRCSPAASCRPCPRRSLFGRSTGR